MNVKRPKFQSSRGASSWTALGGFSDRKRRRKQNEAWHKLSKNVPLWVGLSVSKNAVSGQSARLPGGGSTDLCTSGDPTEAPSVLTSSMPQL